MFFFLSERSYGSFGFWIAISSEKRKKIIYTLEDARSICVVPPPKGLKKVTKITTKTQKSKMNFAHSIITHNIHHLLLLFVVV